MPNAQLIRKSYISQPGRPEFNDEERSIVSVISTDSVDRDLEVVIPRGLDLEAFRKNPVVVVCHKYDEIPVAKCLWIKVDGGVLKAKTQFRDNEKGREYYEAYKGGFLNGFSVGFIPDRSEYGPPTRKELDANPHWKGAKGVIRKAELVEYSVVPIPCNRDALARAIESGDLILKAITADLGLEEKSKDPQTEVDGYKADEDDKKKEKEEGHCPPKKHYLTKEEYLNQLDPATIAEQIRLGVLESVNVENVVKERIHVARGGV